MTSERVGDQTPTPACKSSRDPLKRGRRDDDPFQDGTPSVSAFEAADTAEASDASRVDSLIYKKNGEPVSLDEFAARNTSEDNASFRDIMEVGLEKKRQRYAWLYEKESQAADAVRQQTTLAITDGKVCSSTVSCMVYTL